MPDGKNLDIGFEAFKAIGRAMSAKENSSGKVLAIVRLADKVQPLAGWDKVGGKMMQRMERKGDHESDRRVYQQTFRRY